MLYLKAISVFQSASGEQRIVTVHNQQIDPPLVTNYRVRKSRAWFESPGASMLALQADGSLLIDGVAHTFVLLIS